MLLGFVECDIGQVVEQAVQQATEFSVGAGGSEFTGNSEHRIVLPVDGGSDLRSLSLRSKGFKGGHRLTGQDGQGKSNRQIPTLSCYDRYCEINQNRAINIPRAKPMSPFYVWPIRIAAEHRMISLQEFEHALSNVPPPARNDRLDCENALSALLITSEFDNACAVEHARHIALALDLFMETGITPLYLWIDDRDQGRLPSSTLPYDITLATALHRDSSGLWINSVWELAHRDKRVNLVLHHTDMDSSFCGHTPLFEVFAAAPPSHTLYQDLRWVPYRYRPDIDTFMDADCGPPDYPAQQRFLRKPHSVAPELAR